MQRVLATMAALSLSTSALADSPYLTTNGTCPGPVTIEVHGLTPGGAYAIISGNGAGSQAIPGGSCAGVASGMTGLKLRATGNADGAGSLSLTPNFPGAVCAAWVQTLDLTTCELTAARQVGTSCNTGGYIDPVLGGCWYTGDLGQSCDDVCRSHGGLDTFASQHNGNDIGFTFWPDKYDGGDWETTECSSTDNNTNWGANGYTVNGLFTHPACHLNCSCAF